MSAEAPARPRRKLDVRIVSHGRPDVPGAVRNTDLSLLGSSTRTSGRMSARGDSNPDCHHTRAYTCTCEDDPCK